MQTEAQKTATQKWQKKNMVVLSCKVRRDRADRVRAAAAANGDTINGILRQALDQYLEEHGEKA